MDYITSQDLFLFVTMIIALLAYIDRVNKRE